jgi:hypothetical protein
MIREKDNSVVKSSNRFASSNQIINYSLLWWIIIQCDDNCVSGNYFIHIYDNNIRHIDDAKYKQHFSLKQIRLFFIESIRRSWLLKSTPTYTSFADNDITFSESWKIFSRRLFEIFLSIHDEIIFVYEDKILSRSITMHMFV